MKKALQAQHANYRKPGSDCCHFAQQKLEAQTDFRHKPPATTARYCSIRAKL
jgi:hypothetical protein